MTIIGFGISLIGGLILLFVSIHKIKEDKSDTTYQKKKLKTANLDQIERDIERYSNLEKEAFDKLEYWQIPDQAFKVLDVFTPLFNTNSFTISYRYTGQCVTLNYDVE